MGKTRYLLANIIIVLVIAALGIGGYYYYYESTNYVKTDDAKVTGDLVSVSSTAAGKLTEWQGTEGSTIDQNQTIGKVAAGNQSVAVTAPIGGTVVQSKAIKGQMVTPGQPLAQVVDMNKLYIQANIEETDIADVKVGDDVDILVDADTNTTFTGKVETVGYATNSLFSIIPTQNASGDYTKVVQRIPVKISVDNLPAGIVPGMNATVKIHK
ncbi:HlyD family secretion protein [Aneurinibacillus sp. BA2021]|nr:HlyD family secretion protein [Aneurinibacillus sp. BA2021]